MFNVNPRHLRSKSPASTEIGGAAESGFEPLRAGASGFGCGFGCALAPLAAGPVQLSSKTEKRLKDAESRLSHRPVASSLRATRHRSRLPVHWTSELRASPKTGEASLAQGHRAPRGLVFSSISDRPRRPHVGPSFAARGKNPEATAGRCSILKGHRAEPLLHISRHSGLSVLAPVGVRTQILSVQRSFSMLQRLCHSAERNYIFHIVMPCGSACAFSSRFSPTECPHLHGARSIVHVSVLTKIIIRFQHKCFGMELALADSGTLTRPGVKILC